MLHALHCRHHTVQKSLEQDNEEESWPTLELHFTYTGGSRFHTLLRGNRFVEAIVVDVSAHKSPCHFPSSLFPSNHNTLLYFFLAWSLCPPPSIRASLLPRMPRHQKLSAPAIGDGGSRQGEARPDAISLLPAALLM
ncbi:hypothetical protein E2C01_043548 [Portunus trituberculatus]|uniref:Uncharacterized protein n=1 Tax=Portunus trituberculatus TaxID=210409 RepID=A0A5B7FW13_PORTR|nr:hypothetical protein [Portunus trituberculatus]